MNVRTKLGSYFFNGPFISNVQLARFSGVYVITTLDSLGNHVVLDVGESHNVQQRVSNHDRTLEWQRNKLSGLYVWTHHCDEYARMVLETVLRAEYRPVCGIR